MTDYLRTDVATEYSSNPMLSAWAEAPSTQEMKNKQPLTPSGPSGKMWNTLLYKLGIRRRYVTTGNVCDTKLPGNNTEVLWKVTDKGNFKCHEQWHDLAARFRQRILEDPSQLQIFLGETPLVAAFGPDYGGKLQQVRGHPFFMGDGKIVIPTHHPASTLPGYTPANFWLMFFDIHKGLRLAREGRDVRPFKIWIPGRNWVEHRL